MARLAPAAAVLMGLAVPSIAWGRGLVNTFAALGLALALACLWADRRRADPWVAGARPLLTGLAVVAAAWLPSVAFSIAPLESLKTWGLVVGLLAGGVAAHRFFALDPWRAELGLKSLVAVAAAAAVYAGLRYGLPAGWQPGLATDRMDLVFKAAANLFALLVPVVLWAGVRLGGRWRGLAAVAVAGAVAMLAGSDSRAALAGLLAGVLAAAAAVILRRRWWWVLAPVALLVAGAFWYLYRRMAGVDLGDLEIFAPAWLIDVHRQHIWTFVLRGFADHPLVGVGMGAAKLMPGAIEMIPGIPAAWVPAHPHNWLVEVLGETGLVGAVPLVALVLGLILAWLRAWLRDGDGAALALFTLVTMFFASGLFNFSLWRAYWLIGLIVPFALVTAARRSAQT
ncbi:O-antigen ligase family protein [Novispirillum sp. DQ9]|uniref:O-antigen ligase family protein n=1 Tax=Novispirillum sp. DQ9 TaxID=3398612 RepID=UPI003C7D8060